MNKKIDLQFLEMSPFFHMENDVKPFIGAFGMRPASTGMVRCRSSISQILAAAPTPLFNSV